MAKKKKKTSAKKTSASKPMAAMKASPKKARKTARRGPPKNPSELKGAANSQFVKEVMIPVDVPKPTEIRTRPPSSGQTSTERVMKVTNPQRGMATPNAFDLVKVSTGVTKKRVASYLII